MNYDMIDRFLRNNLGDDDYAEYSAALNSLCTPPQLTWVGLTYEEAKKLWESTDSYWELMRLTEDKLKDKNLTFNAYLNGQTVNK
jgi:pyruvate/2-oxoglutarate dehydrogenase complex dihydrolipoamide dehydrogenase (E3) component